MLGKRRSNLSPAEQRLAALGDQVDGRAPLEPRESGRRAGREFRESSGRRWVKVLSGFLVLALLVGLGIGAYGLWRYSEIHKLDLGSVLSRSNSNQPMTVLLVGSDERSNLTAGQKKQFGSGAAVAGQRSDTIMLLRIDPSTQRAAILSLPRDLYVDIAGTDRKDRINSAFDGGAGPLITTITNNFNIPIDHYVEVNFDSFRGIVSSVGGVQVPFATPVRDFDPSTGRNLSGLSIAHAGCINLQGDEALSYVRSRHYEIYDRGRWVPDPLSDLGRVQRQQDFVRRVAHKAVAKGTNPLTFNALVSSIVKNLKVDKGMTFGDMTKLAKRFKSLDPNSIEMLTFPTTPKVVNGNDVLLPSATQADSTVQQFLQGGATTTTSSDTSTPAKAGLNKSTTTAAASRFVPGTAATCG